MSQYILIESDLLTELVSKVDSMNTALLEIKNQMNPKKKLMTQSEVAKKLGISRQTIINHTNQGLITPEIINNRPYYTEEIIDNYIKNKTI